MKRLVVLGAGESGSGAAVLAKMKGYDVFVSDKGSIKDEYKALLNQHRIEWEELQHSEDKIMNADEVVKSPGIPDTAPLIQSLKAKGTPIISEIEFAARYTNAKMICITGSNGKTTTTTLVFEILKNAGLNVSLAGNIGRSLALQVACEEHDYYVIELSSFQLDNMYEFKADIAILLNITPDHLNRYNYEFQNYVNAKFRITQNQTPNDAFIYWAGDPVISEQLKKLRLKATLYPFGDKNDGHNIAYLDNEFLIFSQPNDYQPLAIPTEELALKGKHNSYNSMAAGIAARILHIKKEDIRDSLNSFSGVEHRLEYVATIRNVRFVNDSKATNVNSCWYALESMKTPTVLIVGGTDKGNDYSEIDELVKEKVHTIVYLGVDNQKLHQHFDSIVPHVIDTHDIETAVKEAYNAAKEGDTVLLSPCCASFDLFKNYEDRGRQFKHCVRTL